MTDYNAHVMMQLRDHCRHVISMKKEERVQQVYDFIDSAALFGIW